MVTESSSELKYGSMVELIRDASTADYEILNEAYSAMRHQHELLLWSI